MLVDLIYFIKIENLPDAQSPRVFYSIDAVAPEQCESYQSRANSSYSLAFAPPGC
jgi:hypothetical protein